ncbi:MAG: OadG family protein [Parabacteroides sp.]
MENIETGLLLMAVGMTTVFLILLIVINLGKGLIQLVNKYAPEETVVKKQHTVAAQTVHPSGNISNQETAAVVAAVSAATFGKGKVVKIEKI